MRSTSRYVFSSTAPSRPSNPSELAGEWSSSGHHGYVCVAYVYSLHPKGKDAMFLNISEQAIHRTIGPCTATKMEIPLVQESCHREYMFSIWKVGSTSSFGAHEPQATIRVTDQGLMNLVTGRLYARMGISPEGLAISPRQHLPERHQKRGHQNAAFPDDSACGGHTSQSVLAQRDTGVATHVPTTQITLATYDLEFDTPQRIAGGKSSPSTRHSPIWRVACTTSEMQNVSIYTPRWPNERIRIGNGERAIPQRKRKAG